jgi:hypothetical protein
MFYFIFKVYLDFQTECLWDLLTRIKEMYPSNCKELVITRLWHQRAFCFFIKSADRGDVY